MHLNVRAKRKTAVKYSGFMLYQISGRLKVKAYADPGNKKPTVWIVLTQLQAIAAGTMRLYRLLNFTSSKMKVMPVCLKPEVEGFVCRLFHCIVTVLKRIILSGGMIISFQMSNTI